MASVQSLSGFKEEKRKEKISQQTEKMQQKQKQAKNNNKKNKPTPCRRPRWRRTISARWLTPACLSDQRVRFSYGPRTMPPCTCLHSCSVTGKKKKKKKKKQKQREREKVNIGETWGEWCPENIPARVFFKNQSPPLGCGFDSESPRSGFLGKKKTPR